MKFTIEIASFNDLQNLCWAGAQDTLSTILENDKAEELMEYLESYFDFTDDACSLTSLNDFLWFDRDLIYSDLGIELA